MSVLFGLESESCQGSKEGSKVFSDILGMSLQQQNENGKWAEVEGRA